MRYIKMVQLFVELLLLKPFRNTLVEFIVNHQVFQSIIMLMLLEGELMLLLNKSIGLEEIPGEHFGVNKAISE